MQITLKLFALFRENRFRKKVMELESGMSVRQLIEGQGIDTAEVGVTMINSRHCSMDDILADGDVVAIFPLVGGG